MLLFWGQRWNPASLFAAGEQGALFYLDDALGASGDGVFLFQDAAGTTPVTLVGDPVGLYLDRRFGLARGAEMATATYATVTTFDNGTSVVSASAFTQTPGTTTGRTFLALTTVANQWYEVKCNIDSVTSGAAQMSARANGTGTGATLAATASVTSGALMLKFQATGASSSILWATASAAAAVNASGITVKSLPGNHRIQTTPGSRGALQRNATTGRLYLARDGIDDFESGTMNMSSASMVLVVPSYRKTSDAVAQVLCEFTVNSGATAGSFGLFAPPAAATSSYGFRSAGTAPSTSTVTAAAVAPDTSAIIATGDITASQKTLQVNGGATATNNNAQGTGTFADSVVYYGSRAGASLFCSGEEYALIIRGGALPSAAVIAQAQLWAAGKAGITF